MLDASEWARSSQPIIKHNVGRRDTLDVIMFKAALYQNQDTLCNGDPSMSSTAQEDHSRCGSMWLCRNNRALSQMEPRRGLENFLPILLPLNKSYHPRVSQVAGKSLILCDVITLLSVFTSVGAFLILRGFEKKCDVNTLLD